MGYLTESSLEDHPPGPDPLSASKLRHDLLTPVNHLMGYSEILLDEWAGNPTLTAHVQGIHGAATELMTLINMALPGGPTSTEAAIETLRMLLPAPLDLVVQLVSAIRTDASTEAISAGEADLAKLLSAVETIRGMLAEPDRGSTATGGVTPQIPALHPLTSIGAGQPAEREPQTAAAGTAGRILVVDDNALTRDLFSRRLERDGYIVIQAENGLKALEILANERFDVVLLDVIMPEIDGLEVLRRLQSSGRLQGMSVIMLSALDEVQQAAHCIELGAEDYLTKPFNPRELVARVKAILRRSERVTDDPAPIQFGDLLIDPARREVRVDSRSLELRTQEFDLLLTLAEHRGRVLSREQILEKAWGFDFYGQTRTVDVHVAHLRKKLEPSTVRIETVTGIGYKLVITR